MNKPTDRTVTSPMHTDSPRRGGLASLAAYSYRVPLCVPYWNWRTYAAMLRCVALGRVVDGADVVRLEQRLAALYATFSTVAIASGRAALELALRATGVREGDEVIVPTFCCTSIIPPIRAVGALPVLADVGEELSLTPETVDAACTPRTRAVVVAHLFGNPAPIEAIGDVCRARGLTLIDDAAQAFGARVNGRLLGTFGDAGILSFGNGKVCFGVGGGVLISRHADVLARARAIRLRHDTIGGVLRQAMSVLVWRRWRRWSLPVHMVLTRLLRRQTPAVEYAPRHLPNLNAAVAMSLVTALDANLQARRARAAAYRDLLREDAGIDVLPHRDGSACLTQVTRICDGERVALAVVQALRAAGYEVQRSYQPLHQQPEYAGFAHGEFTVVERLAPTLVELPCEPSVSLDDVARIAAVIRA